MIPAKSKCEHDRKYSWKMGSSERIKAFTHKCPFCVPTDEKHECFFRELDLKDMTNVCSCGKKQPMVVVGNPQPPKSVEPNLIELFNRFIEKWTGNSFPHLIDSDENDGERFREAIASALTQARQEGFELAKQRAIKIADTYECHYSHKDCTCFQASCDILEAIEKITEGEA